ncbi:MAG: hypothetical protein IJ428_04250 [Clostridia bacterium]|nr:hypothetical protein [Clostridia bacterium]
MKKRFVSAALLTVILTSFASCAGDGTNVDTNVDTGLSEDTVKTVENYPAGVEPQNYDLTFNILYPNWGLYPNYFFADDENASDAMSKALYDREILVEEHLGVSITNTQVANHKEVQPAVQQMVMSGEDTYQLALTHCIRGVSPMLTDGMLLDLENLDMQLDEAWWNTDALDALRLNGKLYYAISDYMLPDPNCILFNKSLIEVYDLEDPYELVRSGEWTLDKMTEMAEVATTENGDSVWDHNDTYGVTSGDGWFFSSFIYSSGLGLSEIDDEGSIELIFKVDDRSTELMEKLDKLFNSGNSYIYGDDVEPGSVDISSGRCLFNVNTVNQLHTLRDSNVDFGILPYPKLNKEQTGYFNNDWSGLMCVPSTVKNTEMISDVIELLSYYSDETVIPAYFDLALGNKMTRDDDSKEMLNIIFDNIVFDVGLNYLGFGENMKAYFYAPYFSVIQTGQNTFASYYASYEQAALAEIAEFNQAVKELK